MVTALSADEVRVKGLEPPHLAAPDPKSGVSTNSTTPAFVINLPAKGNLDSVKIGLQIYAFNRNCKAFPRNFTIFEFP